MLFLFDLSTFGGKVSKQFIFRSLKMVCFTSVEQSSEVLQTMFVTKKHTDISLLAGPNKTKVEAHKAVLTSALEYFDLMLSGTFKEAEEGEVIISEIEPEILEKIIKFLYCGIVEIDDMKTATQLWEATHLMKITPLQKHILEYMRNNVAPENSLGLFYVGEKYDLKDLTDQAVTLSVRELDKVIENNQFKELTRDELINFLKLAKEKSNEKQIAEAILNWLDFDESRDKLYFKELLQTIEIDFIDQLDLINRIEGKCTDVEDLKYVIDAIKGRYLDHSFLKTNSDVLLSVQDNGNGQKCIYKYNPENYQLIAKKPVQIHGQILGIWNKTIVVQQKVNEKSFKIELYDIQGLYITVIGVFETDEYCVSRLMKTALYIIYKYFIVKIDLETKSQSKIEAVNFVFSDFSVVEVGQKHYFLTHNHYEDEIMISNYDSDEEMWLSCDGISDVPSGDIVSHDGSIYFFNKSGLKVYLPSEEIWIAQEEISEVSVKKSFISINKKLLVLMQGNNLCEYINGGFRLVNIDFNKLFDKNHLQMFILYK